MAPTKLNLKGCITFPKPISFEVFGKWIYQDHNIYLNYSSFSISVATSLIYLDDIRPIIFSAFKVKFTSITEVMQPVKDKDIVDFEDTIETIMNRFETTQQSILPVVQNKVFVGFISKADILEKYREQLKELVIE